MKEIEGAMHLFSFDVGRYPDAGEGMEALTRDHRSLKTWRGPYLSKELPADISTDALGRSAFSVASMFSSYAM